VVSPANPNSRLGYISEVDRQCYYDEQGRFLRSTCDDHSDLVPARNELAHADNQGTDGQLVCDDGFRESLQTSRATNQAVIKGLRRVPLQLQCEDTGARRDLELGSVFDVLCDRLDHQVLTLNDEGVEQNTIPTDLRPNIKKPMMLRFDQSIAVSSSMRENDWCRFRAAWPPQQQSSNRCWQS
jgi:hypothetical protein